MKARSELMMALAEVIRERGMTQGEAAALFGVTQPRVSDLVRGKVNLFSLDTLVAMTATAGMAPMVMAAKGGDVQAARLILKRILPPVKAIEQAVKIRLPEGGKLTAKASAVLTATAAGDLAPGQAAQLIAALGTLAKIHEIDELATRITNLEKQHAKS